MNTEADHVSIYTIGYEGLEIGAFIDKLKKQGIEMLLDIREIAISRKSGFSKRCLADALRQNGIEYKHIPALGSPSEIRRYLKSTGDFIKFYEGYMNHLKGHYSELLLIEDLIETRRCCLLCYEKKPEICHRQLIARELQNLSKNTKVEVVHL
ncbi:MAG TPA: DUF488 domain-containing protein [Clostridia bacterium]|nr:DUF488 domain-containing protein [Clostridia bacterium]